ncbi:MAG: diaminopimelate epimerase [Christensenellales bacterium]
MKFSKMHGLGNDFILINAFKQALPQEEISAVSERLCDRRTGIGADGLILMAPSKGCDVQMRIFNSDGSEAEMCGNGIRCLAKFALDEGVVSASQLTVETLAGTMRPLVLHNSPQTAQVRVDMGAPVLERSQIPMLGPDGGVDRELLEIEGQTFIVSALAVGVPHLIVFCDDLSCIDIVCWGSRMEVHPSFPRRTNVNFVQVLDTHTLKMRTWERGAGATKACGTGACSAAVAARIAGFCQDETDVHIELGTLRIAYDGTGSVFMSGPAETVFRGEL